jgi:hypothetical protein
MRQYEKQKNAKALRYKNAKNRKYMNAKKCSGLYNPEHPNLLSLSYQRMQQMITICCCHRIHGRCFSAAFLNDGNQGNVPAHW